jgi:hypothetical protein
MDGGHSPPHMEYTRIQAKKSRHRKVIITKRLLNSSNTSTEDGTFLSRLWKSLMQTLNKGKVLSEDNKVTFSDRGTSLHRSNKGYFLTFLPSDWKGLLSHYSMFTTSTASNKAQLLLPFSVRVTTNHVTMYIQLHCILTNHCNTCCTQTLLSTYNATQYHNWAAHILNVCKFTKTDQTHNQNLEGPDKSNEVMKHCNLAVQSAQQISTNYRITFCEVSVVGLCIKVFL